MTAIDYLVQCSNFCGGYFSHEKFNKDKPLQKASNSEMRRWLKSKSVLINGRTPDWDEIVEFPVTELVLFPRSKKNRCTLMQTAERYREFLKEYGSCFGEE
jgi:preprotein translocase subunit Sss1